MTAKQQIGLKRTWYVTYDGRFTSTDYIVFSDEITVEDVLKSKISCEMYQYTNKLAGDVMTCFLRRNADGCEIQCQVWNVNAIKSTKIYFKDKDGMLYAKIKYLNSDIDIGRAVMVVEKDAKRLMPYDFDAMPYDVFSAYFPGNIVIESE